MGYHYYFKKSMRHALSVTGSPGTRPLDMRPHRASWFLLGEIVRRLDGREFAQYVRQEIFEPLQMTDSWIAMSPETCRAYGDRLAIMQTTETGQPVDAELDTEAALTHARPASSGHGPVRELGSVYETLLAGKCGEFDAAAASFPPRPSKPS